MKALPLLLSCAFFASSLWAADNWPEFRGPTADGHSDATGLPLEFGEGSHVKWKTAIHGKGWSCPVIWGSQVWLTTATEDGTELSALCLDKDTGKILRDELLFKVGTPQFCHKFNSYASPTPVIEEGRIYVNFGSPGTACLDTKTGAKIWERTDFVCNHYRGAGSSPIVWKDLLIMNFDGSDFQFMVALDKKTGKTVWKADRSVNYNDLDESGKPKAEGDMRKAFSTPRVIEVNGQPVLLSSGAKAHYGYDPRTGKELWRLEDPTHHSAASRPIVGFGMAFISAGFSRGAVYAVKLGGSGTLDPSQVTWQLTKGAPSKPSLLLIDDLLYMINDGGVATAVEAQTGNVVWSERVGGNFSAAPLYADGKIYLCNEEGKITVLAPGRQYQVLAENHFDSGIMASPAASGKALYIRTKTDMYRVEQ
jgi:outer membrane protein assembly factor BamB